MEVAFRFVFVSVLVELMKRLNVLDHQPRKGHVKPLHALPQLWYLGMVPGAHGLIGIHVQNHAATDINGGISISCSFFAIFHLFTRNKDGFFCVTA